MKLNSSSSPISFLEIMKAQGRSIRNPTEEESKIKNRESKIILTPSEAFSNESVISNPPPDSHQNQGKG